MRFEYRAGGSQVELLGEVGDWLNAIAVPGSLELDLPPGVYQYKLRVSGTDWLTDPANPRTRSADGCRNSVAVVGGAPEPWLFAPAPPWIVELERGGLRVLVGVRRGGAVAPPAIRWSEDDGRTWSRAPAEAAFEEDEHVFFVAMVPASAATVRFALDASFEAMWTRPPAAERVPAWWKRATVYGIFVDRFRPERDRPQWERDPGRGALAGGHLEGIRRSLPELAELGIDALYLTPVHVGASSHRYDVVDPLRVDPALGGEDAYRALAEAAREHGMRLLQDLSFAHAGRGFGPYEDVRANGRASSLASWFQWKGDVLVHYGRRTDAPLFDQTCPAVRDLVLDTVDLWARLGASGLRLDMTAEVPLDLGRRIRRRFKDRVPDGIVFGELVPQHAWRWRNAGVVDASTDFAFHEVVTELVTGKTPAAEAFARLQRTELLRGDDARVHAVRFLSTHDHPRLASLVAAEPLVLRAAFAFLLALPGIPMLLYGEELGLHATGPRRHPEDVWPDRMPMPWTTPRQADTRADLRALLRARADSEALRAGPVQLLFGDATTLVVRREVPGEIVDVAISFDRAPKALEISDDEHPALDVLVALGGAEARGPNIVLPPYSAIVFRRRAALGREVSPMAARRNLVLRDRDLEHGAALAAARPSRFFFSVTERCNLRCEHCITHAPERTRSGAARTMTPAVLDALTGDLRFGEYFAFVHGGESLTAPIFFDVLDAIARARGSSPYVVHLLTNGVLLDAKTAARLVAQGVSSISISLDGATAETNDAIRVGGRFALITENVRALVALRRREGKDLRIGISTVVLRQNLAELEAMVDLAVDLGVDWLKLEEAVPATPFAKRSLVRCADVDSRSAIDAAIARGRAGGLVMVDHTLERAVWRCRLDAATQAFLEADEHANRCTIHPCRTPWETACIEPNGDVRASDFFGPILGNLTRSPLEALWNADAVQRVRREAAASRLCGPSGPVVCLGGLADDG